MRTRYPRTPHLPWSPGATSDDVRVSNLSGFIGQEVVVTEKMDGENTTLGRSYTHARSLDSAHHVSRSWVKALHGRIAAHIPEGWRVCGENLYARHSVPYDTLPAYFLAFNIWDDTHTCLSRDDTVAWCERVGVPVAPVLYRGPFDERALRALRVDTRTCEGFVVRLARAFHRDDFRQSLAKWVRRGHVTDTSGVHWMHRTIEPNGLGPEASLWTVRSKGTVDCQSVLQAIGLDDLTTTDLAPLAARLDVLDRPAEARLAGVVAGALLGGAARPNPMWLPHLRAHLSPDTARAVAMLVQLVRHPTFSVQDDTRRAGLVQLARSVDLGVLHALAGWWCAHTGDSEGAEQVAWSELHSDDAGLLAADPFVHLRKGLRSTLSGDPHADALWTGVLRAFGAGRLRSPEEARALLPSLQSTFRGGSVTVLVGPAGSGKSTWTRAQPEATLISLDDLRAQRGDRSDQSHNAAVLRDAVAQLVEALRAEQHIIWDATSITARQRALVLDKARRYAVPTRIVSVLTPAPALHERNRSRQHSVPEAVLADQCASIQWPLASEADTVLDVDTAGTHRAERFGGAPS